MKLIIPLTILILSPFAYSQVDYSASATDLKEYGIRSRIELGVNTFTEFQDTVTIVIIHYNPQGYSEQLNSSSIPNNNNNKETVVWETLPDGSKRKASSTSTWYDEMKDDSLAQTIQYFYTEFGKIQRVLNSQEYLNLKEVFESEALYIYDERNFIIEIQYRQGKGELVAKSIFKYETE